MITFADYLYEAERRKEEIAQAEQHRLRRQISKQNLQVANGRLRLLARLGELLVTWGCQLQTRFAAEGNANPCPG